MAIRYAIVDFFSAIHVAFESVEAESFFYILLMFLVGREQENSFLKLIRSRATQIESIGISKIKLGPISLN